MSERQFQVVIWILVFYHWKDHFRVVLYIVLYIIQQYIMRTVHQLNDIWHTNHGFICLWFDTNCIQIEDFTCKNAQISYCSNMIWYKCSYQVNFFDGQEAGSMKPRKNTCMHTVAIICPYVVGIYVVHVGKPSPKHSVLLRTRTAVTFCN